MQRLIKFRAVDGGKMVTEESSGLKSSEILSRYSRVEQYTGFIDKDCSEIYEGDIIDEKYQWVVVHERGCFLVKKQSELYPYKTLFEIINLRRTAGCPCKIVGNIHQI